MPTKRFLLIFWRFIQVLAFLVAVREIAAVGYDWFETGFGEHFAANVMIFFLSIAVMIVATIEASRLSMIMTMEAAVEVRQ